VRGRVTGGLVSAAIALTALAISTGASPHAAPLRTPAPAPLQSLLGTATADLPFDPQLASVSCPVERGPVKEGSDADRFHVSTTVVKTSVAYLRARPKPSHYPRNYRVTSAELHTYQVTAYLTQYKIEADGDIHLVLKDGSGRSMIAEIPFASCVPTASRWRTSIASARAYFLTRLHTTTSWHYLHHLVDVRGIGYMDPPHGQTGAAPNGLELHPVTYLHLH
jgi:hypothetical protein